MKSEQQIKDRLTDLQSETTTFHHKSSDADPGSMFDNAARALLQAQLEAMIRVFNWVLDN